MTPCRGLAAASWPGPRCCWRPAAPTPPRPGPTGRPPRRRPRRSRPRPHRPPRHRPCASGRRRRGCWSSATSCSAGGWRSPRPRPARCASWQTGSGRPTSRSATWRARSPTTGRPSSRATTRSPHRPAPSPGWSGWASTRCRWPTTTSATSAYRSCSPPSTGSGRAGSCRSVRAATSPPRAGPPCSSTTGSGSASSASTRSARPPLPHPAPRGRCRCGCRRAPGHCSSRTSTTSPASWSGSTAGSTWWWCSPTGGTSTSTRPSRSSPWSAGRWCGPAPTSSSGATPTWCRGWSRWVGRWWPTRWATSSSTWTSSTTRWRASPSPRPSGGTGWSTSSSGPTGWVPTSPRGRSPAPRRRDPRRRARAQPGPVRPSLSQGVRASQASSSRPVRSSWARLTTAGRSAGEW